MSGLTFDIFGKDVSATKAIKNVEGQAAKSSAGIGGAFKHWGTAAAASVAGLAGGAVKLAADYQEATTKLVTGAGESEDAIGGVQQGMLKLAGAVGQTPQELANGMFLIESAGFHGADGLKVLKSAAEGAKIGGAQMATVADGLTTAMKDYQIPTSQAADTTSKLVATVAAGKTNMQDLSSSLAQVLPFAAGLKIGFNQVMGAMATMTGEGIPAAQAATMLKFTMMSLANETPKGKKALDAVGLSANQLTESLKSKGLSGTLGMITDAIGKKFPKGSTKYNAALADIVGGTRGMGATLALTGQNLGTFNANIKSIGAATAESGGHVKGWSETSKDLNVQLAKVKDGAIAFGIGLASRVIPILSAVVGWFTNNIGLVKDLAMVLTPLIAAWATYAAITKAAAIAQAVLNAVMEANPIILVVAAIALLVAGVIIAWKKFQGFRNVVHDVFNAIKDTIGTVVDWVKNHWPILLAILTGPIGAATIFIIRHWDQIKSAASGVFNWVRDKFNAVVSFVTGLPGRIGNAARGMWDGVKNAFRSAIDWIIRGWNSIQFKIPGFHIGPVGFGGFTLGLPNIPLLAQGTGFFRGGLAVVGDGGPELVRLPIGSAVLNRQTAMSHLRGGSGDVMQINVRVEGGLATEVGVQRALVSALEHAVGSNGMHMNISKGIR